MFTKNYRISFGPNAWGLKILELDNEYLINKGYSEDEIDLLNNRLVFYEETVKLPRIKNDVQIDELVELDSFLSGMYDSYWGAVGLIRNVLNTVPFIVVDGGRIITEQTCLEQMELSKTIINRYSPEKYKEIFV